MMESLQGPDRDRRFFAVVRSVRAAMGVWVPFPAMWPRMVRRIGALLFLTFTGCGHGSPLLPTVDRCGRPVTPPVVTCHDFLREAPDRKISLPDTRVYDICWIAGECFYRCPQGVGSDGP